MNEVTNIHLGRQAFVIATDAHKELRTYLEAIKEVVSDKEVVEEVEMRMAELLAERKISGDKVILAIDVAFLKSQLGDPADFHEEADPEARSESGSSDIKRLFRDTDNAMVAGVAAGLAKYFGIDVLLVRILFVIGIFTGGWGILLYIALWLLVPEAKTSSERLQMAGKSVTVNSIKETVARADVAGTAKRVNHSLAGPINAIFRIILKIIGLGFIVTGLSLLFALIALTGYVALRTGSLFGQDIFPVGFRENLLLYLGMGLAALASIMVIILGVSIFKQKWPIKAWVTGALVGLALLGLAGVTALAADAAPQIRNRYNSHLHTSIRAIEPFTAITANAPGVTIRYQVASDYSVGLSYFDSPNLSNIKTTVTNGTLLIDTSRFSNNRDCSSTCLPPTYNMVITIYSPKPLEFFNPYGVIVPSPDSPPEVPGRVVLPTSN